MHRLTRLAAGLLAAGAIATVTTVGTRSASAQNSAKLLTVGNTPLFLLRVGDTLNGQELTIADRINKVQDVFAKYLGGQSGKVTTKKWGDRVHLYLNGDFFMAVTPADAQATHHKSTATLAPIWAAAFEKAFDQGHTPSTGTTRR
ncbi:MAG: hypothetical protein K0Q72_3299 [Armatimonadetes bacterium]|jgi:hypothetical protein|nr:hypothetical protein [Armatimonadota bacterium]